MLVKLFSLFNISSFNSSFSKFFFRCEKRVGHEFIIHTHTMIILPWLIIKTSNNNNYWSIDQSQHIFFAYFSQFIHPSILLLLTDWNEWKKMCVFFLVNEWKNRWWKKMAFHFDLKSNQIESIKKKWKEKKKIMMIRSLRISYIYSFTITFDDWDVLPSQCFHFFFIFQKKNV